ncbi:LamG-like jellyroll fold domain-containing protein [Zobellia uliginosa]|uniref:LamG-like jellyroll fold domain-containing protein n=1 Tax=Zobellia uliginosa TaxID=143224 RepID=UPI001C0703A6|nr:LamG-like jellyroll fold domain-containing protein [Zobellia uliginosa]MBU2947371.1 hypothetical protein [Zobellia uliginosa]
MSTPIIHYLLDKLAVANKDGSKAATVKNCNLIDVPRNTVSPLKKALVFNGNSSLTTTVNKTEYDTKKFYSKILIKTPAEISNRQNILETTALPVAVFLSPGKKTSDVQLHVSLNNKKSGWGGATLLFNKELKVNTWYKIEFAYDLDTLAVFVNGRLTKINAYHDGLLKFGTGNKFFIGSWIDGRKFPFKGAIAEVQFNKGIPAAIEQKLDLERSSKDWHISRKCDEIKPELNFGNPTRTIINSSEFSIQHYQFGAIIYSNLGTFEMHGGIYGKYKSLSNTVRLRLGALQSDEINGNQSGARKNLFRGGGIYWSGSTGAIVVLGQIYVDYENIGGSGHHIGLPTKDESRITSGKMQLFQRGRMYFKNKSSSAKEVHGSILAKYLKLGGHTKMGYPISDELNIKTGSRNIGKLSDFEKCSIYWSPGVGAFEIYGTIRETYKEVGGPTGSLGFPTSGQEKIPRANGAKYNTFQKGTITWFGSKDETYICYPFEIFLDRIKVRDADGDILMFKDDSDVFARIDVFENNRLVNSKRLPNTGTYSNTTEANLKYTVPRVLTPNNVNDKFKLKLEAWDDDSSFRGHNDYLGKYEKELNILNAWGLKDNTGIYNRASGSHSMQLDWSVRPKIKQGQKSDRDYYFWGVKNWGNTNSIDWNVYADAFRDVTRGSNFSDHISLRSLYYELVAKNAPKGGNCFGMSLEGIYALKCMSRFGKPLDRFSKIQIQREINIKHLYQLGAAPIWWFVGQFISGNTHNPKDVFNESQACARRGDRPVICISQDYYFTKKPHCIFPWKWNQSKIPWEITCFDPNVINKETIVKVDPNRNTYQYTGSSSYSGGEWSGGRFHYMPWRVLNTAPRTPNWEIFALLLLGSIIIFGEEVETEAIVDANGNNIDGNKVKQSDSLAQRSKMFVPYPGLDSIKPFNMYFQKGQALNNNFKHKLKGRKTAEFKYGISNLNQEIIINSQIKAAEREEYDIKRLGRIDNNISVLSQKSKLYKIIYSQKLGATGETLRLRVENVPTDIRKQLQFNIKPQFEGLDIISSGGRANGRVITEILDKNDKIKSRSEFNINIENGIRLRATNLLQNNQLLIGKIDRLNGTIRNPIRINSN